jgi:hypothetical protein
MGPTMYLYESVWSIARDHVYEVIRESPAKGERLP